MTTTSIPSIRSRSSTVRTRRLMVGSVVAVFVLITVYFGIGAYTASRVTQVDRNRPHGSDTPGTFGLTYADVRFPARSDGLAIAAWYIPRADSTRVMILVHGRNSSKQDAIAGRFVALAAALHRAGYAVLMVDLRGHGASEGERYSYGVYERRDVLGAVDWLMSQGFAPGSIGTLGLSLGAASVIGAAAEEPAIGLVITEGAFADLYPLMAPNWQKESGLPTFFLPGVFLMNQMLYGYSVGDLRPVDEIARLAPRPVLLIHCRTDEQVGLSHADALKHALPSAETWYADGCKHAQIYRDYPQVYEERIIGFLDANFH